MLSVPLFSQAIFMAFASPSPQVSYPGAVPREIQIPDRGSGN